MLAKERELNISQGDLIAIMDTGAYGSAMSSNYNSRLIVPEILVDGSSAKLIKKRQSFEDSITLEKNL